MKEQISMFPNDNKKFVLWTEEEDKHITNIDKLLSGDLPKNRNLNGCVRRMDDIIKSIEDELENAMRCKKVLQMLGNKNKTLKVKEK